jgi:hypothetical protein
MKLLKIVVIATLCIWAAVEVAYPSITLHYRLTLEAEVDGQPKSGSGVIAVTYSKQVEMAGHDLSVSYKGEAVALDLGSRGTLFALLKEGTDYRSGPEWIVLRAFDFDGGSLPRPVQEGIRQLRRLSGKRELPLGSLPMLVRFRNIDDPSTVERVSPDIAERFGPGARLTRATLEIVPAGVWPLSVLGITGVPITTGIEKRLPWLNHLNKYNAVPGNPFTSRLPLEINGFRDPWR